MGLIVFVIGIIFIFQVLVFVTIEINGFFIFENGGLFVFDIAIIYNKYICERPRKKHPSKKRFGYLLEHLSFWVSGMESPLIFFYKKYEKK